MAISIVESPPYKNNHRRFTVFFFDTQITTVVTSIPSVVRRWLCSTRYIYCDCHHLRNLVVGLGVQWTPNRYAGDFQPAATLQLCVGRRCLIFQLTHAVDVPVFLRRFLTDQRNTLVGLWNHSDAKKLQDSKHHLEVGELLDLRHYAVSKDGESLHLSPIETIVEKCLGLDVKFDREISRSDWNNYNLSGEQILQACVDAHVSFLIGKDLKAWELRSSSSTDVDSETSS
ncbi:hypothetical protein LguiA_000964 [Lonicera macranthoides]